MHTYFVLSQKLEAVKIGKSRQPVKRVEALATSNPDRLVLLGAVEGDCEREFHDRFAEYRINREWFGLGPRLRELLETERQLAVELSPGCLWIMPGTSGAILARSTSCPLSVRDVASLFRIREQTVVALGILGLRVSGEKWYRQEDVSAYVESRVEYPWQSSRKLRHKVFING
jgi:Meiotically up-regulated gene 113